MGWRRFSVSFFFQLEEEARIWMLADMMMNETGITDPTRRDNPIILASQAFTRHSGCNMDYILGRNCRFMQGPGTTVDSCRRFAISMKEERDHSGIFVNYRRDGSPFLSLVMNAQLVDR